MFPKVQFSLYLCVNIIVIILYSHIDIILMKTGFMYVISNPTKSVNR